MAEIWGAALASAAVGAGASIYGSNQAAKAAGKGAEASIGESRRQFDLVRQDTAPYRQAGVGALDKLARLYGLGSVGSGAPQRQAGSQRFKPSEIVRLKSQGMSIDDIISLGYLGGEGSKELSYLQNSGFTADDISRLQQGRFSAPAPGAAASETAAPDMSVFTESPDYQFNLGEGQKAIDRSLAARGRALSGAGVREGVRYASGMASNEFGNFYNRLANIAGLGQAGVSQSASAGAQAAGNIGAAYQNAGNARASAYMTGAQGVNNAVQGGIGNYLLMNYLKPGAA